MNREDRALMQKMEVKINLLEDCINNLRNWKEEHMKTSEKHEDRFMALWVVIGIQSAFIGVLSAYIF